MKITERKILAKAKGELESVSIASERADGTQLITTDIIWSYGDSVAVLPYGAQRRCVLTLRQIRAAPFIRAGESIREACAGAIEPTDTSIETAVRREAREELGCTLAALEKVGEVYINPARLCERAHLFLAPFTALGMAATVQQQDEVENIEVLPLSFTQLYQELQQGKMRCPRLLMLAQALFLKYPETMHKG
ncbi:NUDIX domain-containing protein [Polycladidibacter hongkongensis]|uniref:NUDIX domain-containing protein n=1 Tax=Polycladidibacter hongkongensis TaxID=1647556 RepID=UPI00082DF00B|nr:NUDIX hydrolase [Pseudovibrio hongkongensis]